MMMMFVGCDPKLLVPYTHCSAVCNRNESAYVAMGLQDFMYDCDLQRHDGSGKITTLECSENCTFYTAVRGDPVS